MKRLLAGLLCLAMMLSLAGCGSEESGGADTGKDYVYVPEYKTLEGVGSFGGGSTVVRDGKLYFQSWNWDEETGIGTSEICSLDVNSLETTVLSQMQDSNENVQQLAVLEDGSLLKLVNTYTEDGITSWFLAIMDASGNETMRQDISVAVMEGISAEWGAYPQDMKVDKDGNVYLLLSGEDEKVLVLSAQGQKLFEVALSSWSQGLCSSSDGRVFILCYDMGEGGGGYMLQQVDPTTKALGETYKGIPNANGSLRIVSGGEDEFLVSSGNVLYSYDLKTQTCEELLNWIDCDINSDNIQAFTRLEDGRVLAFTYNYEAEEGGTEAVYLTKTPASEVKQKTVLTYATMYLDYMLRGEIIRFNKNNDTYRIEVKEYGNGDYSAGQTQLNSDIVSGNPPDLIDMGNGMNVDVYISKGILTDLYPLLENDPDLKKEDLTASALRLYEQEGKLYGMPVSYSLQTLLGRTSDVGEEMGWTLADVKALLASKPEGTQLFDYASRELVLSMLLQMDMDSYVDWNAGTCSFDSDAFVEVLEFAATFPSAENMDYNNEEGVYTRISSGKLLLLSLYVSQVNDFQAYASMFDGPVTCIGYPTQSGSGSIMAASTGLGISEKSANKDGAWAFISSLLTEEYQDNLGWNFPVRESSLEKCFDEARNLEEGTSSWSWDDYNYEGKPATEEEIAVIRSLIDNAQPMPSASTEILTIITEEAAPFFAGQKSAREVADIIQSRVKIYVSENS